MKVRWTNGVSGALEIIEGTREEVTQHLIKEVLPWLHEGDKLIVEEVDT